MRRLWKIVELSIFFARQMFVANIQVAILVMRPNSFLRPVVFRYSFELRSDLALTILANLITLTPGTLTLEVLKESSELVVHTIHAPNPEKVISGIRNGFERRLKEIFE